MSVSSKRLEEGIIQLRDGSVAYSIEKAISEFRNIQDIEYSVNDLILFLLYSHLDKSITSRIAMYKEVFTIEREVFGEYLLTWDRAPGIDSDKLVNFLLNVTKLKWLRTANISKSENNKSINIYQSKNSLSIKLDRDQTKAIVSDDNKPKYDWKPLYTFFVKKNEKGLDIYKKIMNIEDCGFVPYYYGPYSFYVAHKLDNLVSMGLIDRSGKKNTRAEEFKLTHLGASVIREKYDSLSLRVRKKLEYWRKGLDQYGVDGILNHVYSYYPQFKTRSKIAYRYKSISWGKGKG
jgi:hypothetical protein